MRSYFLERGRILALDRWPCKQIISAAHSSKISLSLTLSLSLSLSLARSLPPSHQSEQHTSPGYLWPSTALRNRGVGNKAFLHYFYILVFICVSDHEKEWMVTVEIVYIAHTSSKAISVAVCESPHNLDIPETVLLRDSCWQCSFQQQYNLLCSFVFMQESCSKHIGMLLASIARTGVMKKQ